MEPRPEQPTQNQSASEQVQNPEEMTHIERIQHIQFLAKDIKRRRNEYISRALNSRKGVS